MFYDVLMVSKDAIRVCLWSWIVGLLCGCLIPIGLYFSLRKFLKTKESKIKGFYHCFYCPDENSHIGLLDNGKPFQILCHHHAHTFFKPHFCQKLNRKCPYFK